MPVEHACCSKRQDGAPRAAAAPDGSGGMIIPGHHDLEILRKFGSLRMGISWQHLANLHQSSELVCLDPGGHQCARAPGAVGDRVKPASVCVSIGIKEIEGVGRDERSCGLVFRLCCIC